jgi:hypothetical protein
MTKARDLSDPAWQDSTSDEQIALSIQRGRGSMPGFPLPESTIASLVRLVRLFDARGPNATASATAPRDAAPGASAAPDEAEQ